MNLAALLTDHPFADSEELLHDPDRTITAGAARAAAADRAAALREAGVRPGHPVAVRLPDSADHVVAMFAVWSADAVLVPVSDRLPPPEVDRILTATRPAAIVDGDGIHPLDDPMVHDEGIAFVMWTSGTTGAPKPILHTHHDYVELLDRVLGPLRGGARDGDRRPSPNLIPVPLATNAGLYNTLFGLRAGAALVILGRFEPHVFADAVRRFGIRSTVLPPAALTMLNDADDVPDLRPLRYVRSITAPLSPLQARRFTERFGAVVLNGYGQAEIGEVIGWTAADARDHPDRIGAAGRAHPGVGVRVVDDGGRNVDGNEIGRLLVRPPRRAVGLDERTDADGFVDTGDLARVDDAGFVWIEGRAGDVINRGGNKVFPDQVEEVLRLAPEVADAAVVAAPDERLGEVPVAYVVTTAGIEDAQLRSLCREHLAAYKIPTEFRRVSELPRNEVGKVQRALLRPAVHDAAL